MYTNVHGGKIYSAKEVYAHSPPGTGQAFEELEAWLGAALSSSSSPHVFSCTTTHGKRSTINIGSSAHQHKISCVKGLEWLHVYQGGFPVLNIDTAVLCVFSLRSGPLFLCTY